MRRIRPEFIVTTSQPPLLMDAISTSAKSMAAGNEGEDWAVQNPLGCCVLLGVAFWGPVALYVAGVL